MVRLRRKTQIDMIDAPLELGLFLGRMHFDCEIRASKLAHPASYTVIWPGWKNLAVSQLQHLFWAESDTDIAALAIILPDDVKESFFGFSHLFALVCCSPHSIQQTERCSSGKVNF